MSMGDAWQLLALVALMALSAFFSASETALMALNRLRLRSMTEEKVPKADLIAKLLRNPGISWVSFWWAITLSILARLL
jgi:putative hemolysin